MKQHLHTVVAFAAVTVQASIHSGKGRGTAKIQNRWMRVNRYRMKVFSEGTLNEGPNVGSPSMTCKRIT